MVSEAPAATERWTIANEIAAVIADELAGVEDGHCVRVNHLDEGLARSVIATLLNLKRASLHVAILEAIPSPGDPFVVTPDQAIEIRNRKAGALCLFVPAGAHDSTASSLGNSFSSLDGPSLIRTAYERRRASPETRGAAQTADAIHRQATTRFRPTYSDLLDFTLAAQTRIDRGERQDIGLELWRVGLIPDAGSDFETRLRLNRNAVVELARPARVSAGLDERVTKLKLTAESARSVAANLHGKNLQNARTWTKSLAEARDGTFNNWRAIENAPVDCDQVTIAPFIDVLGVKNPKGTGLSQEVDGGPLFAQVGDKKKLKVSWTTEPKNTTVPKWLLELVPAEERKSEEDDFFDLPALEKKGSQKTASIPLEIDLLDDESALENTAVCFQITAISADGQPLLNREGVVVSARSDEFYLTTQEIGPGPDGKTPRDLKRMSATVAEGVLRAVVTAKGSVDGVTNPDWKPGDQTTTFTMKATAKETITVVFSALLDRLQRRTLALEDPLGAWSLTIGGGAVDLSQIVGSSDVREAVDEEKRYLAERRSFFKKLADQPKRNRIEVADWDDKSLQRAAIAHARAWSRWLDVAEGEDLVRARGVDTLRVHASAQASTALDSLIVLSTHPLRALWFAGHGALLTHWGRRLEDVDPSKRKDQVQLDLLATISAVNVPAFAHHREVASPFVFFRNLDADHGVALPADTHDPALKLAELAQHFNLPTTPSLADEEQSDRAADTIDRFHASHPYADPFRIALINPDDGAFAGDALGAWASVKERDHRAQMNIADADEDPPDLPRLTITAYLNDRRANLRGLDAQRKLSEESTMIEPSDHLQPALALIVQPAARLEEGTGQPRASDQHHLAIIQDFSKPVPAAMPSLENTGEFSSLGVHGLVTRYVGQLRAAVGRYAWDYWIEPNPPVVPNPVDKALSDALAEAHRAASAATARLLDGEMPRAVPFARAGLHVELSQRQVDLLDRIHEGSDWVLTVDRFIGADLFDSPDEALTSSGRPKYILDAAPSFQDGFGHRSLVTTSSRDEINRLLSRALEEFGLPGSQVDDLIQALKVASGRLVLDALRRETRAREVVALAIALSWLIGARKLADSLVVPVDIHADLFSSARGGKSDRSQQADLVFFKS